MPPQHRKLTNATDFNSRLNPEIKKKTEPSGRAMNSLKPSPDLCAAPIPISADMR